MLFNLRSDYTQRIKASSRGMKDIWPKPFFARNPARFPLCKLHFGGFFFCDAPQDLLEAAAEPNLPWLHPPVREFGEAEALSSDLRTAQRFFQDGCVAPNTSLASLSHGFAQKSSLGVPEEVKYSHL